MVRAFCVGQVKSGTGSLFGLLAKNFPAAHEPEREEFLGIILDLYNGEISAEAFRTYLVERDQRLRNEIDIAWANQFIIDHLLVVFPNAKFIVLIRDAYTWLGSIVGHLVSREIPQDVIDFLNFWMKPDCYPFTPDDRGLKENGLYSLVSFLQAWNDHVDGCMYRIPRDKRLVIKTSELNRSHEKIADFLTIPVAQFDMERSHINKSSWDDSLESLVDKEYVNEMTEQICSRNMLRFYPEISNMDDAYRRWEAEVEGK